MSSLINWSDNNSVFHKTNFSFDTLQQQIIMDTTTGVFSWINLTNPTSFSYKTTVESIYTYT